MAALYRESLAIAGRLTTTDTRADPRLCLVFAPGTRPDAASLGQLAAGADAGFAVSNREPDGSWAELLANGLTFDCRGLAPSPAMALPPAGPAVGLAALPGGDVIDLAPGPHLANAAGLLPVLRGLAGLGACLAGMPGVTAVVWTPAGSWVEPTVFRRSVADWLGGGVFPALALTAIEREDNGAMVSRGLALIAGQELRLEPDRRIPAAAMARIAVRLIHELVLHGPVDRETEFTGPGGEGLLVVPVRDRTQLRVLIRPASS